MCGGSEAGVAAGCGRRTASVCRLLFSHSVGVRRADGAERRTGTRDLYYAARPQPTGGAEQHGAVRTAGRPGPAPQQSPFHLFIASVSFLFPNMDTTACWLLVAAHFILICPQGKACYHSRFCPHMTQSARRFGFYDRVVFNLVRQLQVSCVRNKPKRSSCRLHFCIFVIMRSLLLCFISRTEPAVRNALCVFGNI